MFILLLLLIVTFVYSVIGVVIFQSYTQSSRNDLAFHQCFKYVLQLYGSERLNRRQYMAIAYATMGIDYTQDTTISIVLQISNILLIKCQMPGDFMGHNMSFIL